VLREGRSGEDGDRVGRAANGEGQEFRRRRKGKGRSANAGERIGKETYEPAMALTNCRI
jgi:hypothetical protein